MTHGEQRAIRRAGHEQYRRWLMGVGPWCSPFHAWGEPLYVGTWGSWTLEGLYQGLKIVCLAKCDLVDPTVSFSRIRDNYVHVPEIMRVQGGLRGSPYFQVLKSGRTFNAARNRLLGQLPNGARNWSFCDLWIHPVTGKWIDRDAFYPFYEEVFRRQLARYPEELTRLGRMWAHGEHLVTAAMRAAHPHLRIIEQSIHAL